MTTPTEPGFYWYREMENEDWKIVDVDLYRKELWVWFHGNEVERGITDLTGEWGPKIDPPDTDYPNATFEEKRGKEMMRKNENFKEVQNITLVPYPGKLDFKIADKYELEAARLGKLLWEHATMVQRDMDISEQGTTKIMDCIIAGEVRFERERVLAVIEAWRISHDFEKKGRTLRHVIEELLDPDGELIETKDEYDARTNKEP